MRFTYRVALAAFAAALALGALGASAALAAPEWWTSSTATTVEWQQAKAKISTAVPVAIKGNVILEDSAVESLVECNDTGEGTVGPGTASKVTAMTVSGCVLLKAGKCSALYTKENPGAVGLPWTGVLSDESSLMDKLGAEPGYQYHCNNPTLGKFQEKCVAPGGFTPTASNEEAGVDLVFEQKGLNCNVGGKGVGTLRGSQHLEATKGGKVEANYVEGVFTKVTTPVPVTGTGKLRLEDSSGPGVECTFRTEGTVESTGKGKIESFVSEGCSGLRECESVQRVAMVNVPWGTELYDTGSGATRERIVSGGSGTPEWEFQCKNLSRPDTCGLNTTMGLANYSEGDVGEAFDGESNRTSCTFGGKESGKWTGELKLRTSKAGAVKYTS
jgi:hypothetical protein